MFAVLEDITSEIRAYFRTEVPPPPPEPEPEPKPPLLAVLHKLGIEPFNREAVEKYKAEKLESTFVNVVADCVNRGWRRYEGYEHINRTQEWPVYSVPGFGAQWTDALVAYFSQRTRDGQFISRTGRPRLLAMKWFREEPRDVPEFVRNKMSQIAIENPTVGFMADTLRDQARDYDPFMIAILGDEEYYFEVWGDDDKKFER